VGDARQQTRMLLAGKLRRFRLDELPMAPTYSRAARRGV